VVAVDDHGVRSLSGAAYLIERGVNARSLEGGIDRWSWAIDPSVRRY
jgi:rhodanese-related sulfurtransferase